MNLTPAALETWTHRLLVAAGLSDPHAGDAAEVFRRASMRGLGHHDLGALPQRLGWLTTAGGANPRPNLTQVSAHPAAEVWDADHALGEVSTYQVTRRALALAQTQGVGYAAVRRSNHFLAGDPYVQIAAEQGFMAVVWSNTDAGMGFPGGARKVMGNNPLAWAVGQGEGGLSADLCLAETSIGNLNALVDAGASVPDHWGRGADGQPAQTAARLKAGVIEPIGGFKGLSLALLGEVLTGVLAGGATFDQVPPPAGLNGHNQMVLAFSLEAFGGAAAVEGRVADLRSRLTQAGLGRLPGDRSRQAQARAEVDGIPIPAGLEASLKDWSARLGVSFP